MLKFLKSGLQLGKKIRQLFQGKIDDSHIEDLEQLLYEADLGSELIQELIEKTKTLSRKNPLLKTEELIEELKKDLKKHFHFAPTTPSFTSIPQVILIVGVNGNGKTTSCAKLAKRYKDQGKDVLFAAADTFRAAAIDQLELWSKNVGIDLVKGKPQSDPAAVVFDALQAAQSRGKEYVIIDTAGRLHTKTELMRELEKIRRVCGKAIPEAPHETYLVLDATTGQNAIDQATTFHKFTPVTGLILTKLDGTAKGGAVLTIQQKLKIPIKYIGIGEGMDDLRPFDSEAFIDDLFS